jgi:hypothetical protein
VQNYVAESRIAKAKTDLEEIARAIAVYETREGDYAKGDVSDLTGRYLNKAPIDPWGKPYLVATDSGLVISGGPDRDTGTEADNVQAPYQPPLALVQVKWVDRNQSGAVDKQNVPDQVQLFFSRKLMEQGHADDPGDIASFSTDNDMDDLLKLSTGEIVSDQFDIPSTTLLSNKKVVVMNVATTTNAFVPGSDTIELNVNPTTGNGYFYDLAANRSIASQAVKILPQ